MPADPFCPVCEVHLSLHPEVSPWGCGIAGQKADLLDRFSGMFQPQHDQEPNRAR